MMLIELRRLHADILMNLRAIEQLTAQPNAPMDRLPAVRLKLTRASRARMILLERYYDLLITRAPPERNAALVALRSEGKDALVASTQHIATWTLQEIAARWPDYCAASDALRLKMRGRVRQEALLIYPLLADQAIPVLAA